AAARERARRVDGEHGDLLPEADQMEAEVLDEGALAHPWHAAHADAGCAARWWSARVLSTSVIALASARRLPARTSAASASGRLGADGGITPPSLRHLRSAGAPAARPSGSSSRGRRSPSRP